MVEALNEFLSHEAGGLPLSIWGAIGAGGLGLCMFLAEVIRVMGEGE